MEDVPGFMKDPARSEAGQEIPIRADERAEYRGRYYRAQVVVKENDDIIYQFFDYKVPDFRNFLAEIIEAHFGSTSAFSAAYIPDLESLGVRAQNVRSHPFFSWEHYAKDFLDLVDGCIGESKVKAS